MPTLSLEEQEVHFSIVADEPDVVHVYCDYPKWQRKLESIGAVLVRESGQGRHYTMHVDQFLVRKGKPKRAPLTEEQKRKLAAQFGR